MFANLIWYAYCLPPHSFKSRNEKGSKKTKRDQLPAHTITGEAVANSRAIVEEEMIVVVVAAALPFICDSSCAWVAKFKQPSEMTARS